MRVVLDAVGKGRREHALPATSTAYESGRATLASAETAQRPTVLGLIASGRMRPDTGRVEFDGRTDASDTRRRASHGLARDTTAAALRHRVALVDAPDVSEPEPNVTLAGVAAEELMFAGRRSDPVAVRRWLDAHGLGEAASVPVSNVDPADRVRALCELAVLRTGVEGIVLVSPDRHGGEPAAWWAIAEEFAARGFAVLVIAGQASHSVAERARNAVVERACESKRRDKPDAALLPPVVERARNAVVERACESKRRDETPRTIGRPRLRRLTAPTKGGRA